MRDEAAADRRAAFEGDPGRMAHAAMAGPRPESGSAGMPVSVACMPERLERRRRVLKRTGSSFRDWEPVASQYLKTVMDSVFGGQPFRDEILRC